MKPFMDELIGSLSHIKRWLNPQVKEAAQKEAMFHFISQCVGSECTLESIKEQLLKKELFIPKELITVAQQMAADEYSRCNPMPQLVLSMGPELEVKLKDAEIKPLFCKDTIYHASICSHAVSVCNAGNYQEFFKNKEFVPGHSFKAVSFSRSKDKTFLIAQKGEDTFYFAFKGKPNLSDWAKNYKSFNQGMRILIIILL